MTTQFLMLTLVAGLMIISPGPDFAIVVKNSLFFGRKAGIYSAFGIALANLCHVAINLLGIGVIISQSVFVFTIMKILGASYLIYLGIKGLRATSSAHKALEVFSTKTVAQAPKGFYSGLLTSLLNPKACLFFLSFFSVILSPATPIGIQMGYGVWISFLALSWFILVAVFFTSAAIAERVTRFKHWLERFTGGVLVLLGLKLINSEVSG